MVAQLYSAEWCHVTDVLENVCSLPVLALTLGMVQQWIGWWFVGRQSYEGQYPWHRFPTSLPQYATTSKSFSLHTSCWHLTVRVFPRMTREHFSLLGWELPEMLLTLKPKAATDSSVVSNAGPFELFPPPCTHIYVRTCAMLGTEVSWGIRTSATLDSKGSHTHMRALNTKSWVVMTHVYATHLLHHVVRAVLVVT